MITLLELNKRAISKNMLKNIQRYSTGIACDNCGKEMQYTDPGIILLTSPPKEAVNCIFCGYKSYLIIT